MDRQTHDVEERAVDALDSRVADPLLDAVTAGFIVGTVVVEVVVDLFVAEYAEPHVGAGREGVAARSRAERHARDHRMAVPRQPAQHGEGVVAVAGLAQYTTVEYDYGVSGHQDVTGVQRRGVGAAFEL